MANDPYVKMVKDGTYQVKAPLAGRALAHVFPYEFRANEEGESWLESPPAGSLFGSGDKYAPR